jgi:hypothetical protein
VDIRSPTWAMVSKCFECLNNVNKSFLSRRYADDEDLQNQSSNLLITAFPIDSAHERRLSITLLRYSLSFFVNEREEFESRDFKGMVYDENQCVGALFGLENLLVLRPKTHAAGALIPRCVLIPNGFPKTQGIHQVRIDIDGVYATEPDERSTLYRTYDVDAELGCLTGNGTLTGTRHLAYLHAMFREGKSRMVQRQQQEWENPVRGNTTHYTVGYTYKVVLGSYLALGCERTCCVILPAEGWPYLYVWTVCPCIYAYVI